MNLKIQGLFFSSKWQHCFFGEKIIEIVIIKKVPKKVKNPPIIFGKIFLVYDIL